MYVKLFKPILNIYFMTNIVIVNKNSTLTTSNVKNIDKETLYKKCNFRKPDGFEKKTTWNVKLSGDTHNIELWARNFGNANTENKYDFPPPCDTELYFGSCCLIKVDNDTIEDLDVELWRKIYEKLFGGFHDLDKSETESEDELEDVPSHMKTKEGYLKDDFIVETDSDKKHSDDGSYDDEESEDFCDSDSSDESELNEECYEYSSDEN